MRKVALLLVAGTLAGGLVQSVDAGNYIPPPGDCCLQWSPRGTLIVFSGNRESVFGVGVVAPGNGPERFVPGIPVGLRSPDWTRVAFVRDGKLVVARVDGSDEHELGETFDAFAWSPDSTRLAFATTTGALVVANADGSGARTIGHGSMPAWSPQGHLIAYSTGARVHVVRNDGSADTPSSTRVDVNPVWSPDGTRLAYWSSDGTTAFLRVVRIGGNGGSLRFEIRGAVTNGAIVWTPDGRTVYGAGSAGLVGIDLDTARRHTLTGISNAAFSPDGSLIAFTAGGECRDRIGIYIADARAHTRRRITNSCSIYGTDGPDVLHGDFSRVLYGLGGNDTLYADDVYYFFDGISLYGGAGNDVLSGGDAQDILDGGPEATC